MPDTTLPAIDARMTGMAHALRFLAADAVEQAGTGHPGMPLGMADIATVLFTRHLKFDAAAPRWPDRDRFVLSNGHGSMLLYGLLHLTGHADAPLDELKRFRKSHARAAAHPEFRHFEAIETTTGPLGQGLATAVGMAIAERLLRAEFGTDLVDHRTWVFAGDGCLMEGVSQEAISLAGHLKLARLTVVFDDNGTTIDGATTVSTSDDHLKRFEASGWATIAVDGHDMAAVDAALAFARQSDRPTLVAARTRIGFGAPTKEGKAIVHGSPLGGDELAGLRRNLGWTHAAFEVPETLGAPWRDAALHALAAGARGSGSGNRSAKDAGATWGTVKYQFGDIDGLWAAVLRHTAERRGAIPSHAAPQGSLAERVAAILDVLYDGLGSTDSRAIENLRAALPRDRTELEERFPQTAAELASWQRTWITDCQNAFSDLDVDPDRVREVALFIPGAMRGITSERQLGSYIDLDEARHALSAAIVAYLRAG